MGQNQLEKAKLLLERLREGTISPAEEALLLRWLNQYQTRLEDEISEESLELATAELKERLDQYVVRSGQRRMSRIRYWAAASVVLVGLGLGVYFLSPLSEREHDEIAFDHDPGHDQAVLVLEDGREIPLGKSSGDRIQAGVYEIRHTPDSGLIYLSAGLDVVEGEIPHNTLQTPRGGQYNLVLPDGSQVWLNSDSRITYPVHFGDSREVTVVGEAYFKVKRDDEKPFVVHAGLQRIDVLGTEFNVKAYPEGKFTETVLVSGSLRASSATVPHLSRTIEPGQYVLMREPKAIGSGPANVAKVTAWRHGDFFFEDETLPEIMNVLARWYDVDVVYDTEMSSKGRFGGVISRDKKLSAVLQMLESTGKVKFKITEKEVVLMD